MHETLSPAELQNLVTSSPGPCISLYMPVLHGGNDSQQCQIQITNLLREVMARLDGQLPEQELETLLDPAWQLANDRLFWQQQRNETLALLLAPGFFQSYWLPIRVEERLVVDQRFHLTPLIAAFATGGHYYVLALSQQRARLLRGDQHTLVEVPVAALPGSLEDALALDEPERLSRSRPRAGGGGFFHGHGEAADSPKERLERYFQLIDHAVAGQLRGEHAPLIMAGVEYELPIYRSVNSYAGLADEAISGNPDHMGLDTLHQQARAVAQPIFDRARQQAAQRYLDLAGTPARSTSYLRVLVPAAWQGRVDTLFVAVDRMQWGFWEPETGALSLLAEYQPGAVEILNLVALETLGHAGSVYAVPAEQVPGGGPCAAILRY